MARSSRLSGFYRKSVDERRGQLREETFIGVKDDLVLESGGISTADADRFSENVLGVLSLPFSVAPNFLVNGRDVLVPMSIEEPSVVAAAANAARLVRQAGGFTAEADPSLMAAQVEVRGIDDVAAATAALMDQREAILEAAARGSPEIVKFGGGVRDLEVRDVTLHGGEHILVVHIIVDCADAMGANTVNSMAEAASELIASTAGGRAGLRILTNLADRRLARARCTVSLEVLGSYRGAGGADPARVRDGIIAAWELADADPYRAATNNKGIMNGVDALAVATGNDWRALEAGAHAFAARSGRYRSLSRWSEAGDGSLAGEIEMPAAVGIVGGMTTYHPVARLALEIASIEKASDLARLLASVGLAQNLAALLALSTEGIQRGHMRLHAKRT
ncbi:MAG: hydroxymethylglutaryl-CoA reductase, degradative [Deltaproteobacteria bacterium]|nr:hydroxymethylglutaryl-CoA reductase, degradative [Deltaproteobacteria bacterium]